MNKLINFIIFAIPPFLLGSCALAVIGTRIHCEITKQPEKCPTIRVWRND